jgi:hypothetical protein
MHDALYDYPDKTGGVAPSHIGQVMKVGFMLNNHVVRRVEVGVVKALRGGEGDGEIEGAFTHSCEFLGWRWKKVEFIIVWVAMEINTIRQDAPAFVRCEYAVSIRKGHYSGYVQEE